MALLFCREVMVEAIYFSKAYIKRRYAPVFRRFNPLMQVKRDKSSQNRPLWTSGKMAGRGLTHKKIDGLTT